ncbi:Homeobox-leucine zipper protein HOX18 [Platanthera guangdongensis]|uniref:Homeobox-leucine zipper protein HOX18 n=1 Tax=Platanthera guangdongensis TaxID=2320717 RepID=A0ABR2LZ06_9ASPA
MGEADKCDTALGLAIGSSHGRDDSTVAKGGRRRETEPPKVLRLHLWFHSGTGEDDEEEEEEEIGPPSMDSEKSEKSFPNTKNKSEKRGGGGGDEDDGGGARKKLRLSAEQSTLLEDEFRGHNGTLTSLQKEELARRLGLRPRQVEVWFQNRRARFERACVETR